MRSVRRLLLGLLPVVFVLGSCGDSYQVAARVGDLQITHEELAEKAGAFAGSEQFMAQIQRPPSDDEGRVRQEVVAEVLNLDIQAELYRMQLGGLPEDAETAQLRSQVEERFGSWFASFPDDLLDETIDDITVLQVANQNGVAPPDVDVYVSPRYGGVDAAGVLSVPDGPRPGSASPAAPTGP